MSYAWVMHELCMNFKKSICILQKLCKLCTIMQQLCIVPRMHYYACIMQKLCKLCKNDPKLCKLLKYPMLYNHWGNVMYEWLCSHCYICCYITCYIILCQIACNLTCNIACDIICYKASNLIGKPNCYDYCNQCSTIAIVWNAIVLILQSIS